MAYNSLCWDLSYNLFHSLCDSSNILLDKAPVNSSSYLTGWSCLLSLLNRLKVKFNLILLAPPLHINVEADRRFSNYFTEFFVKMITRLKLAAFRVSSAEPIRFLLFDPSFAFWVLLYLHPVIYPSTGGL